MVLSIITVALNNHSQWLFTLTDEGPPVMVFKTVVLLTGFGILDGDVTDEPVIILAERVVVKNTQARNLLTIGADVVVA